MNHCHNHPDSQADYECRACGKQFCQECIYEQAGICHGCVYKGVVIVIIIMVIISYTVWFGLF